MARAFYPSQPCAIDFKTAKPAYLVASISYTSNGGYESYPAFASRGVAADANLATCIFGKAFAPSPVNLSNTNHYSPTVNADTSLSASTSLLTFWFLPVIGSAVQNSTSRNAAVACSALIIADRYIIISVSCGLRARCKAMWWHVTTIFGLFITWLRLWA